MLMKVGVQQWGILKEAQWWMHKRVKFTVSTIISKSTEHAVLWDTMDFLITDEITFTGVQYK